jgi:hypothetical protein
LCTTNLLKISWKGNWKYLKILFIQSFCSSFWGYVVQNKGQYYTLWKINRNNYRSAYSYVLVWCSPTRSKESHENLSPDAKFPANNWTGYSIIWVWFMKATCERKYTIIKKLLREWISTTAMTTMIKMMTKMEFSVSLWLKSTAL